MLASSRRALPALRTASHASRPLAARRAYHVDNVVGKNFPFGYTGEKRTRFTVAYWGLLVGLGFCGIPGVAFWLQMNKYHGNL
ncbi:hypothetical protein JCM8547_008230 [Rhodosporidiobolus lusitaniae]